MTMHKALYTRNVIDRLYVSRKEGDRRRHSIEDSVNASIQRLEDNIGKSEERLIMAFRSNTDIIMINGKTIKIIEMERKTTVWIFQTTNKRKLTQKELDLATERNR